MDVTRRGILGGMLGVGAGLATPAVLRAEGAALRLLSGEELIAAARLGGDVGYVVADARSGLVLEARDGGKPMAPASTAKAITTLYALETLGPQFRFQTRVLATGPVSGGRVEGDLILAGGGDPTLSTDGLADLAAALAQQGVTGVRGRFLVWGGALPYAEAIAADQPVHVGYNPAISGLILNYNRVHFEWKRAKGGYALAMDARSERHVPKVYTADVAAVARQAPLFEYRQAGGREHWTVAASALGKDGSRWLPVRLPEAYAGDVFQTLARARGIDLPAPEPVRALPAGARVLVGQPSEALPKILRSMMKYSTNITAEAVGMTASAARGANAARGASGAAMSDWLSGRLGGTRARFVDHSGLGGDDRIAPIEMVRAVTLLGPKVGLRGLMKPFNLRDEAGGKVKGAQIRVDAKTGTLNFVSTLTGYITAPDGTELTFAIFTGDLARRAQSREAEQAEGSRGWVGRSKLLQSQLITRWATLYG
ncbi:D-alanyl-D-alanine carboxypeptidase/D-alanyl-D-alanine endopeptidase [Rhodobacter capsulatus]|uniref:Penicillin-binding protein 4 n=2 Tax=Rhodobacter capsulatus TaxID=1061 RepID=D5AN67_RHOCB|nr:D-alanyl-D-alanine carboxypeptidase/D-alanyl-D-alanine-endopeptidase [Rhodobacter capsulatus]ADE86357.1 penicillin-binding protein 4 [Rhodobacter capsulatus SB 1003]ETD00843.1 D-alanyl-D-alanine carboxypeptidase [Rhodobacter capsulatus DE442]ETD75245.1 D-alanyl-D-alanine carboxypeptidase [Rhodobacter capsulatus R121]ETD76117.1 D-alanyl-D-alanine carboxypeptidase [Rhodobacter capsulatus B6]ETD91119.1 D-alanyl-D-alanine carboxypeptidase [Rhodobacter capsulatus YW2]